MKLKPKTMKPNFKHLIIFAFFALFCFNSCQDEAVQETENPEESITPNSTVANLMRSTVSNDGSVDDIMDGTDCFSINLPVTIVVNDITITINSLEDLELIEDIFDEFQDDQDTIEFLFPITIILNDFTEISIENEEQLEDFIDECTDDVDDDIIECVDFIYPISFSVYNSDFQLIDTITINSDEALYEFLDSLEDNQNGAIIASLNYPVSLIYADGTTVEVTSNQELEAAINAAEEECDDDDEDDECNLNLEDIEAYLLECGAEAYFSNNENEIDELDFDFLENGILLVTGEPAVIETANWTLFETDEGYVLSISELQTFAIANGDWLLLECDEDDDEWLDLEFTQTENNETITMELEIDCDDEYDCEDLQANIGDDCEDANGNLGFINEDCECEVEDDQFDCEDQQANIGDDCEDANGNLGFINEDCECEIEDEDVFECFDDYSLEVCDDDTDGFATFDLNTIFANCNEDNIEYTFHETLMDAENQVNALSSPYNNIVPNQQTIYSRVFLAGDSSTFEIFEHTLFVQDCNQNNCSEQEIDAMFLECIWNVVNYNGSDDLSVFDFDFNNDGTVIIEGDNQTITAMWSTSQSDSGVIVEFSQVNASNIQAITGNWLVTECDNGVLQLENNTNDIMVMEKTCD